jgi:solute carrier family 13 (sodium-dependent dicarboxylate transporter), member 2/3/5
MRTLQEALGEVESYSPAEERLNRRRRTAGLILGPLIFLTVWWLPISSLGVPAHRLAAVVGLVAVLWLTEALPLAVTAMLGPILAVLVGVAPARAALAPFSDPLVFLLIGSFMMAALASRVVGPNLGRLVAVYAALGAAVSMWVSNIATTALLFPIGLSLIAHFARAAPPGNASVSRFAMGLMLLTSFAPAVGGLATPVGTAPNLIGISLLDRHAGIGVSFFGWVAATLPIAAVLLVFLIGYFHATCLRGLSLPTVSTELVRRELQRLGPMTPGQQNVMIAFGVTVALWVSPGMLSFAGSWGMAWSRTLARTVPEGIAAMVGAVLLFLLPIDWKSRRFTLTWAEAVRIDWGIILLYGGGLALGELAFATGLAEGVGRGLAAWLPAHTPLTLTMLFTAFAILVSEVTSSTVTATMVVPMAIAVAQAAGVRPLEPALGATLGASMGFMMPISAASNAIVYGSGYVPIAAMVRHGLACGVAAFLIIVPCVLAFGRFLS